MNRFDDRVPICTVGSGTHYDGRVWYEPLRSIHSVNGKPVVDVEKSSLRGGDRVTLEYKAKIYCAVVEFPEEPCRDKQPRGVEPRPFSTPEKPLELEEGIPLARKSPRKPKRRVFKHKSASYPISSIVCCPPPKKRLVPKKAGV